METVVIAGAWLVLVAGFACRPAYIKVRERMSPKYAAARKVRLAQKFARAEAKRKQAHDAAAARLKDWATEHADDKTAQAYLATLPANMVSTVASVADEDIEAALHAQQEQADASKRRLQERRLKEAEHLRWALEHPANPVARRHLEEALVEARRGAQYGPGQSQAAQTVADIEVALELAGSDQQ